MARSGNFPKYCTWMLATLLAGCGRGQSESQGPSDWFRHLDANSDGEVDRFEYENEHGSLFPDTLGFRYWDCDANGRVTWHEYFDGQIGGKHCPGQFLYEPAPLPHEENEPYVAVAHEDDELGENWREAPLLVRRDEMVQIYAMTPESPEVPMSLHPGLPARPGRHSEQELSPESLQRLRFSSSALTETELVAHYDPSEKVPGNELRRKFPHVGCEIDNANADVRITMVDVQVLWKVDGRELRARWLKTLRLDPGTTQTLDVWFSDPVDAAECRLLHARGQVR